VVDSRWLCKSTANRDANQIYDSEINRGAGVSLTILRTGDKSAPWKTLVIPEDARHLGGS
jgi:hypothetical protein